MSNFELLDEYQDKSNNNFELERSQLVGSAPYKLADQTAEQHLPPVEFFDPAQQAKDYHKNLDDKLMKEMLGGDGKTEAKTKLKDKYDNDTLDEAVKASMENKVPMVVHIGAPWCVPCKQMDDKVWPGVEKDMKGKAAFVHMNGDEILNDGKGGDAHKKLTSDVESFPHIKVVQPFKDKDGSIQFKLLEEHKGGMTDTETRDLLKKAKIVPSTDAKK